MIYSRSAEYAIRALAHLARRNGGRGAAPACVMAKTIAEEEGIPAQFLAKLLQQMARAGFLKSTKGPTGGFALAEPAREIALVRIIETVDGLEDQKRCPFSGGLCSDADPCGMHDKWKPLRQRIMDYLEKTSIEDLARSLGGRETGKDPGEQKKGARAPKSRGGRASAATKR
mgnify:CR=1 FL=1